MAKEGLAGLANCEASPAMAISKMIQNAIKGHTLEYDQRPSRYKNFDIVQLSLISGRTKTIVAQCMQVCIWHAIIWEDYTSTRCCDDALHLEGGRAGAYRCPQHR